MTDTWRFIIVVILLVAFGALLPLAAEAVAPSKWPPRVASSALLNFAEQPARFTASQQFLRQSF